jgi:hypothetical protein
VTTEQTPAEAPAEVLVRFEIAALGHNWHDEVLVTRTPLVDALIGRGALLVLDGEDVDASGQADELEQSVSEQPAAPVSWFGPETAKA